MPGINIAEMFAKDQGNGFSGNYQPTLKPMAPNPYAPAAQAGNPKGSATLGGIDAAKAQLPEPQQKIAMSRGLGNVPTGVGPQQMNAALAQLGQARALVDPSGTLQEKGLSRGDFDKKITELADRDEDKYNFSDMRKDPKSNSIIKGLLGAIAGGGLGYLGGGLGGGLAGAGIGGAGGAGLGYLGAENENRKLHDTAKVLKEYGLLKPEYLRQALPLLKAGSQDKSAAQDNSEPRLSETGSKSGVTYKHDTQGHATGASAFDTLDGYMKKAELNSFQTQFFTRMIESGMPDVMIQATIKSAGDRFGAEVQAELQDGFEKVGNKWWKKATGLADDAASLWKGPAEKRTIQGFAGGTSKTAPTAAQPKPAPTAAQPKPQAQPQPKAQPQPQPQAQTQPQAAAPKKNRPLAWLGDTYGVPEASRAARGVSANYGKNLRPGKRMAGRLATGAFYGATDPSESIGVAGGDDTSAYSLLGAPIFGMPENFNSWGMTKNTLGGMAAAALGGKGATRAMQRAVTGQGIGEGAGFANAVSQHLGGPQFMGEPTQNALPQVGRNVGTVVPNRVLGRQFATGIPKATKGSKYMGWGDKMDISNLAALGVGSTARAVKNNPRTTAAIAAVGAPLAYGAYDNSQTNAKMREDNQLIQLTEAAERLNQQGQQQEQPPRFLGDGLGPMQAYQDSPAEPQAPAAPPAAQTQETAEQIAASGVDPEVAQAAAEKVPEAEKQVTPSLLGKLQEFGGDAMAFADSLFDGAGDYLKENWPMLLAGVAVGGIGGAALGGRTGSLLGGLGVPLALMFAKQQGLLPSMGGNADQDQGQGQAPSQASGQAKVINQQAAANTSLAGNQSAQ